MSNYVNYTNMDARFQRPYQPGDRLVRGWTGGLALVPVSELAVTTTLEGIYARHNRDDRPDGQLCPSMSIGDVVVIDGAAWSVGRIGFVPVDVDPADLITDRTWSQFFLGEDTD